MNTLLPTKRSLLDDRGRQFFLGNNAAPIQGVHAIYGETPDTRLIPRNEWEYVAQQGREMHPALAVIGVADQGQIGMCNASATTKAMEYCRWCEGLPYVQLSAGDLYHRISHGQDQGSTLEDGITEAGNGVASVTTCPYQQWRTANRFAVAERPRYAAIERYLCPTFDHCMSAVLEGFGLISGVAWYDNYTPDEDGWLPSPDGNSGGHAIFGYAPAFRAGQFGIWHQNSWTRQWGRSGRFVIPESGYTQAIGGWWAVRQTTTEAQDVPAPQFN